MARTSSPCPTLALLLLLVALPAAGATQSGVVCEPNWLPSFGPEPGLLYGDVRAFATFDDGSGAGAALFAGGSFTATGAGPGSARRIAQWTGTVWMPLGSGMNGLGQVLVSALAVYDDGDGPALYAGGNFSSAGGVSANHIAKWDGTSWSPLGSGLNGQVLALVVHDDGSGSGPALYAGGNFSIAGGTPASAVARWDGSSWSPVGSGVNNGILALTVHDDGSGAGPALYAGGNFTTAGGAAAQRVAKWNGSSWSTLGSGLNDFVSTLVSHDDGLGGGPALYVGGGFSTAGGAAANGVARWDGASWSAVGSGTNSGVVTLAVHDEGLGAGPELVAGGYFTVAGGVAAKRIAKWAGGSWSPIGGGIDAGGVLALTAFQDGSGQPARLCIGGSFAHAAGLRMNAVTGWDGARFLPFGSGLNFRVAALLAHDDGTGGGTELYVGGSFNLAGGVEAQRIAKWDGGAWSSLGGGMDWFVNALTAFDDGQGGGPALYAGGTFSLAGGVAADRIAKWDGNAWSAVGGGLGLGDVRTLTVHDDGSGTQLYVGGDLYIAGGLAVNGVARWNGNSWTPVGAGLGGTVQVLAVHDDGSGAGAMLYAGGTFPGGISRWDGSTWTTVGTGVDGDVPGVQALAVFDDGGATGPALYAGGRFTMAGGVPAANIAKWNGSAWSALGSGVGNEWSSVRVLATYDGGTGAGPALFVGGSFVSAGGFPAKNIARWNGPGWSPLGDGLPDFPMALAVYDDGSGGGPALYVGGAFVHSPAGDSYLTQWGGCSAEPGLAYCFGDGSASLCPCGNQGGAGLGCANSSGVGASLTGSGTPSVGADDLTFQAQGLLPLQPALLFAGQNAVNSGAGTAFGDGLRCAGGSLVRLGVRFAVASGQADWGAGLGASGGWSAGEVRRFQVWYRDPAGSPCGSGFNLTHGYEVSFAP